MYIDARKFTYRSEIKTDDNKVVSRDRKFAENAYLKWFESNAAEIIERLWEIDDIGIVEKVGEFVKLIKEAEFTYSLGAYQSAIALIGIAAEDLCRFFASSSGHNLDSLKQYDRINRLYSLGLFDDVIRDEFHEIRRLRNDCLHFNAGFKAKQESILQSDALQSINKLKAIYAKLVGVTSYDAIDPKKLISILDVITREAATGKPDGVANLDDATIRIRNIFAQVTGIDISTNLGHEAEIRWSLFQVDRLDFGLDQPEITLIDIRSGLPVIVDLTLDDVSFLQQIRLTVGEIIVAAISSITNGLGMTSSWNFISKPFKTN